VSRSNLNSSTIHNTTGTFNLVVKDRFAFRLSGAFQSKPQPAYWPVAVLETYLTYRAPSRAVNPCIFCVLHRNPTAFPLPILGERCHFPGDAIRPSLALPIQIKRQYLAERVFKTSKDLLGGSRLPGPLKPFEDAVPESYAPGRSEFGSCRI